MKFNQVNSYTAYIYCHNPSTSNCILKYGMTNNTLFSLYYKNVQEQKRKGLQKFDHIVARLIETSFLRCNISLWFGELPSYLGEFVLSLRFVKNI